MSGITPEPALSARIKARGDMTRTRQGHRGKRTPQIIEALLMHLGKGWSRRAATKAAGISPKTFRTWLHGDDALRQVVTEVEKAASSLRSRYLWLHHGHRGKRPPRPPGARALPFQKPRYRKTRVFR